MEKEQSLAVMKTTPLSAGDMQKQVNIIQEMMQQVMKKDTHFGVIQGCKAPSLYKAGAEKLMSTFRLAARYVVDDLSDNVQSRYRVTAELYSVNGQFVGSGLGECSSFENKYKWRAAVCKEEFDATPVEFRRVKWNKGFKDQPNYSVNQVMTDKADLANTALKMAKKRALVDAVLTTTAASDIFTQDIEDLPEGYIDAEFTQHAEKSEPEIVFYPDADFKKNFAQYERLISSGKKSAAEIIKTVESKGKLTESQKQQLKDVQIKQQQS